MAYAIVRTTKVDPNPAMLPPPSHTRISPRNTP